MLAGDRAAFERHGDLGAGGIGCPFVPGAGGRDVTPAGIDRGMIAGAPLPHVAEVMRGAPPPAWASGLTTIFDVATLARSQRERRREVVEGIDRSDFPHDVVVSDAGEREPSHTLTRCSPCRVS